MAIILEKGKSHDLSISKIWVGLGWEPNEDKSDYPYDLDVSAFMLGVNHKIPADDYLVFYNSEKRVSPDNLLFLEPQSEFKYPSFEEIENNEKKLVTSYEHWRRKLGQWIPSFQLTVQ